VEEKREKGLQGETEYSQRPGGGGGGGGEGKVKGKHWGNLGKGKRELGDEEVQQPGTQTRQNKGVETVQTEKLSNITTGGMN